MSPHDSLFLLRTHSAPGTPWLENTRFACSGLIHGIRWPIAKVSVGCFALKETGYRKMHRQSHADRVSIRDSDETDSEKRWLSFKENLTDNRDVGKRGEPVQYPTMIRLMGVSDTEELGGTTAYPAR